MKKIGLILAALVFVLSPLAHGQFGPQFETWKDNPSYHQPSYPVVFVATYRDPSIGNGGNLGTDGSVAYLFTRKGQLSYASGVDEDALMEAALEAGAEDLEANDDGSVDVTTPWEEFSAVKEALAGAGFDSEQGEVTMIASTTVPVDADGAEKLMGLVDALEELDDVQNVYTNVEIPDEVLAAL